MAGATDRHQSRPPRIRDVAARAQVGVGTVSRVLNDSPGVAGATRERVLKVVAELGYVPSTAARNLALGTTQTLGVVAPFFTQASVVERLRGIDDIVGASRYDLTLFNVETLEQRRDAFSRFARRDRLDGLIVISLPPTPAEVKAMRRERLPVVLVDVAHRGVPGVTIDDVEGGRLAARHLLDAGHRRIAFVGDRDGNPLGFDSSARRLRGLCEVLDAAGAPLDPALARHGLHSRELAATLAAELLTMAPGRRPTAVFAASDTQALGVIDAATAAGLDVPGDVSVVGFDDLELAAALGLTTVRQPLRGTGRLGARMLLAALAGGRPRSQVAIEGVELVARRTVGPPSRADRRPRATA